MRELLARRWSDVDFENLELRVTRSIWHRVVGNCKTAASAKPVRWAATWPRICCGGAVRVPIPKDIQAVHSWQHEVKNDQRVVPRDYAARNTCSHTNRLYAITFCCEIFRNHLADVQVIVHNEKAMHSTTLRPELTTGQLATSVCCTHLFSHRRNVLGR